MALKFKNINGMDYSMLHSRVNSAICQYNNSSDQSEQAKQFIQKVDEVSSSRNEFFDNVEKRLSKLLDPNSQLIDWFVQKKASLEFIISKIKSKEALDSEYTHKFSIEVREGLQCMEKLIGMNTDDLGSLHMGDIMKIKRTISELRAESSNVKATTSATAMSTENTNINNNNNPNVTNAQTRQMVQPSASTFAEDFFYLVLHDIRTKLKVHCRSVAVGAGDQPNTVPLRLEAEINLWHAALGNWNLKFNRPQSAITPFQTSPGYARLVRSVLVLLEELIRVGKQGRVNDTLTSDDSAAEDPERANDHFPLHRLEMLSAIAADIKAEEWRRLQGKRPGGVGGLSASDLDKISFKKRKLTTDIVTKSGASLPITDKQQLQSRLLQEAEAEDVSPMEWLSRLVLSANWGSRVNNQQADEHLKLVYLTSVNE